MVKVREIHPKYVVPGDCWRLPTLPALWRRRQEEPEFELSLGYIMSLNYIWRPCLKKKKKVNSKTCHWDQASGRIIRRRGPTLGWVRDPGRYKQGVGKRAVFRGQG
jgi:hypothetical protein